MDAKKCDRCGKYYDKNNYTYKKNGFVVYGISFELDHNSRANYKDLCDDCLKSLEKWLEDGKENKEV